MSNQIDHRTPKNKNNKRHNERPKFAGGCSDEGHNGALGRKDWVDISHRNERRNAKQGRPPSIGKQRKKTFEVKEQQTMNQGEMRGDGGKRFRYRNGKPKFVETGEMNSAS